MNETIALATFVVTMIGAAFAVFWRMWGLIKDVRTEAAAETESVRTIAEKTARDVSDHRLHVAETYLTKAGMKEVTDQIMTAIGGLGNQITGMQARIDRVLETPPSSSRSHRT